MLSEMTRGDNELEYELLLDVDVKSRKLTFLVDFFGSIISELSSESEFFRHRLIDQFVLYCSTVFPRCVTTNQTTATRYRRIETICSYVYRRFVVIVAAVTFRRTKQ